jgi:hypothetical protein
VRTLVFAAVAAVLVAGCSSPAADKSAGSATAPTSAAPPAPTSSAPASVAPMAAHGVEAALVTVPWSQVGPGWTLATWSPVSGVRPGEQRPAGEPDRGDAATTLYLVNPAGGRYPVTAFPPPGETGSTPELSDWSGDGSHALFRMPYPADSPAILVDLHTGEQTTLSTHGDAGFTRPDGKALLLSAGRFPKSDPLTLKRVDLAGNPQFTYPTDKVDGYSGSYLSTPDGTRLVLSTITGLTLMGNDGTLGATLPVPGQTQCSPLRWWDAASVLADCHVGDTYSTQLWLVPVDGSAPTALTAPNDHQHGPDIGDGMAWKLPAGTFIQASGACGVIYLAKLNPDRTTTQVDVPNTSGSVAVIGVHDSHLDLQARAGCGPGQSLLDYDPAANKTSVLLGPSVNGGGVIDAVAYPGL